MHITHSAVQLQGSHQLLEYRQQRESLRLWRDGPQGRQVLDVQHRSERLHLGQESQRIGADAAASLPTHDRELPARIRNLLPSNPAIINTPPAGTGDTGRVEDNQTAETQLDLKTTMLKLFVERLTGREVVLFDPADLQHEEHPDIAQLRDTDPNAPRSGMRYEFEQTSIEIEKTRFSAQGIVHTADGREIHLELQLSMNREYVEHTRIRIQSGSEQLKDPLVINFNGTAAELTQTRYAFDLDANGQLNEIAFVSPDSGFLALDRNGDGIINDGSELFGALSGKGFAELAQFDDDGNGWIDAADSVFSRLLVWSKDAQGGDHLASLTERDIGAIYLAHAETPFSIKDDSNRLLGQVRSSGIYLNESGMLGSVQQLDLVV